MSDLRTIYATYTNLKFVQTRETYQVIFEVDASMKEKLVNVLGLPGGPQVYVAITTIDLENPSQSQG